MCLGLSSILLLFAFRFGSAATTIGPLASVSIHKLPTYSSARPCAAGCLVYNGIWVCGVNGGYHDLGKDLGCGCGPNNACFCSAGLANSASSYISSCVSTSCSSIGNVEGDLTSMLGLYESYCQTANVEVSTSVQAKTTAADTPESTRTDGVTTAKSMNAVPVETSVSGSATSTQRATDKEQEEDDGLSKSDIIALATGLGVGIPSLLVGAWALYLQLRKKQPKSPASSVAIAPSQTGSQIQMLHLNRPQPHTVPAAQYPIYEIGTERGQRYF